MQGDEQLRDLMLSRARVRRGLALGLLAALAQFSAFAPLAQARVVPGADEILHELKASQARISNAMFECVWKTFIDVRKGPEGVVFPATSRWEKQTFYWDNLGRRRNVLKNGPLSDDGKMLVAQEPCVEDTIYNGEIVVNSKWYPHRTRNGERLVSATRDKGYNAVIIGDAAAPLRRSLESERNPFEYITNVAFREISKAIRRQSIIADPTDDRTIALRIAHTEPDSAFARSVITVAPEHNWVVESIRSYRDNGEIAREILYGYKEQGDGIWVPVRGRHRHWGDRDVNAAPYLDWGFEATKASYNDPSFDQDVFDVRLKADAAVSDTRYDVTYRIGSEGAIGADLARYAADARKNAENATLRLPESESRNTSAVRWRTGIFIINLVMVGACICIIALKQIRRRSQ